LTLFIATTVLAPGSPNPVRARPQLQNHKIKAIRDDLRSLIRETKIDHRLDEDRPIRDTKPPSHTRDDAR